MGQFPIPSSPSSSTSNLPTPSSPTTIINNHHHQKPQQWHQHLHITDPITPTRRTLTLSLIPTVLFPLSSSSASSIPKDTTTTPLDPFIDNTNGFSLLIPSSWTKVEKAGATALFEEEGKGSSNNIGVVVSPVKLASLKDFGSPEFVADKLIQAERRKESTKQAEVISFTERLGHSDLLVYEFEYAVDSTRGGMKRVFTAAFVASKKLYLLNISHLDKADNPLDGKTRTVLEQVLHSFDTTL